MTDGLLLPPGGGRRIQGMTLKAGVEQSTIWATFEAEIAPGFDVGAHLHQRAEEVFYVLEGELDLLAFHPSDCWPPQDHRTKPRSRSYGAATTFTKSRPS